MRPCLRLTDKPSAKRGQLKGASVFVLAAAMGLSGPANAQVQTDQPAVIRDTFGEVGLLEMPSAYMAPDGQLSFTVGGLGNYQRYTASFQALPWLDTSFRYSRAPYWNGSKVYYDRSFGLKIRLHKETDNFPAVSIGVRDLLGTGIYGSEYITASKRIGTLDVTGGLGWGRLADRSIAPNPFGALISSFDKRPPPKTTGTIGFKEFFHGPNVGAFGGIAWRTPVNGLSVLAEYSSDKYSREAVFKGGLKVRSPLNIGLSYKPFDALSLSAGWFYGTTYGFTVGISGNPNDNYQPALRVGPKVPPAIVRSDAHQANALTVMMNRNKDAGAVQRGGPWVYIPTETERTKQNLLEAYYSAARSVRGVDILGKSLVVDARFHTDPQAQCVGYAKIASIDDTKFTTIAMTDLQNPDGQVVFCSIGKGPALTDAVPELTNAQTTQKADAASLKARVNEDLARQDIRFEALSAGQSELWVYFENNRYNVASEAAGRVIRVLMADAPPDMETFHLVFTRYGVPLQEITVARSTVERASVSDVSAYEMAGATKVAAPPLDNPALSEALSRNYPIFSWSFTPKLSEQLFDPDHPLQFNIYGDAAAVVVLAPGLFVSADVTGSFWNNYSFTRPPGSQLPHVRSDVLKYLKEGQYGISSLQVAYRTRLARTVQAEVRAGYFEDMFMGAGGQLLWTPDDSRFSFGADLYQLWQRDYNRLFGIRSYHILTGHASVYYRSPWYGLNFAVHAGRYLAGDYGATFEITRRFASGIEVGAWATFTNVPFSKFGEGSFDKGIMIHIPLEWWLPIFSQSAYDLQLHSLTRDGGQRLAGDDSLYALTRRTDADEIYGHIDNITAP